MLGFTGKDVARSGWEYRVMEEAGRLLRLKEVSPTQAAITRGQRVEVQVIPTWDEVGDSFHLSILCHANGKAVAWEGAPLFIEPAEASQGLLWMHFLDQRGRATVTNLPPGAYRVRLSLSAGASIEDTSSDIRYPYAAASGDLGSATDEEALQATVYESCDRKLRTSLRASAGAVSVTIETHDPGFAGRNVRFFFVAESGRVEHSSAVRLDPVDDEEELWRGHWQGPVGGTEDCRFIFEPVPEETG